ncbi:hypothetical protein [Embleya sp. NPDC050493]|uniref:hypothetical protein n=1 Tax=Embleya sp. NPDC050493 TaxID=3363989 RepID=UPI00379F4C60
MPARPLGANSKLVTARRTLGLHSQAGFADAFEEHALAMGMRLAVSVRQVRRWESADPSYPTPDYRRELRESIEFSANLVGSSPVTPEMTMVSKLRSSALPGASGTAEYPDPR